MGIFSVEYLGPSKILRPKRTIPIVSRVVQHSPRSVRAAARGHPGLLETAIVTGAPPTVDRDRNVTSGTGWGERSGWARNGVIGAQTNTRKSYRVRILFGDETRPCERAERGGDVPLVDLNTPTIVMH